jgi:peptidoglycan/xylan/chitin deacetylase (PgdA/CDA1 family)
MNPLRACFSALSPAGPRARLSVFIFHRVLPRPDPLFPNEVDAVRFDRMLGWIGNWFQVMPLDQAVRQLKARSLPSRAAAITFDDGYADNHTCALPILQRHGMTATFFIATGFLDGGRMWNDTVIESIRACKRPLLDLSPVGLGQHDLQSLAGRQAAIAAVIGQIKYLPPAKRLEITHALTAQAEAQPPDDLMMSASQVRALHQAGMQIGAHTVTHPILARTDIETARVEMTRSRSALEQLLGERVGLFAYPNGRAGNDYLPEHARLAQDLGFDAAVTTNWGAADATTDAYRIPRFTPWDRRRMPFGVRLARNLWHPSQAAVSANA